jgi:hypothetical protein
MRREADSIPHLLPPFSGLKKAGIFWNHIPGKACMAYSPSTIPPPQNIEKSLKERQHVLFIE